MTRSHRRAHLSAWLVLAPAIAALLYFALAQPRPDPAPRPRTAAAAPEPPR